MRILSQSLATVVPPVTDEKSPAAFLQDRSGFAGDGGFIYGSHAFDDFPVVGNEFASLDQHQIALFQFIGVDDGFRAVRAQNAGLHVLLRFFQAFGLRLAPAFGHGFGEVGEQQRDQQNDGYDGVVGRKVAAVAAEDVREEAQQQRHHETYLHHEHDRVFDHVRGVQLRNGSYQRRFQNICVMNEVFVFLLMFVYS